MTKEEKAITVLTHERECVIRASTEGCDRNCENCDLVLPEEDIIESYDLAISALSQPQPDIEAIRQEIKDCIYWPVVTDAQLIQNYAYEHCVYIVDKHIQKGESE